MRVIGGKPIRDTVNVDVYRKFVFKIKKTLKQKFNYFQISEVERLFKKYDQCVDAY